MNIFFFLLSTFINKTSLKNDWGWLSWIHISLSLWFDTVMIRFRSHFFDLPSLIQHRSSSVPLDRRSHFDYHIDLTSFHIDPTAIHFGLALTSFLSISFQSDDFNPPSRSLRFHFGLIWNSRQIRISFTSIRFHVNLTLASLKTMQNIKKAIASGTNGTKETREISTT